MINFLIWHLQGATSIDRVTCPANQCPLDHSFAQWNTFGSGLAFMNIPFPIIGFRSIDVYRAVHNCISVHGDLCHCQLLRRMAAYGNAEICYRRGQLMNIASLLTYFRPTHFCDPLGFKNILISTPTDDSVTLIVAPMDSVTMFTKYSAGAIDPGTSLITILALAETLRRHSVKNVAFALFSGESFENTGSMRFAYDLKNGLLPLNLSRINRLVEIGEMSGSQVFMRFAIDPTDDLKQVLNETGVKEGHGGLPACAIRSFLKHFPTMPHVHLSSYSKQFENRFYHSIFDLDFDTNDHYFNNLDKKAHFGFIEGK
ncbi:hypothetical protein ACOME3_003910 [Neoechinorhynchus agilis]